MQILLVPEESNSLATAPNANEGNEERERAAIVVTAIVVVIEASETPPQRW
jgi:hypothetical protein